MATKVESTIETRIVGGKIDLRFECSLKRLTQEEGRGLVSALRSFVQEMPWIGADKVCPGLEVRTHNDYVELELSWEVAFLNKGQVRKIIRGLEAALDDLAVPGCAVMRS